MWNKPSEKLPTSYRRLLAIWSSKSSPGIKVMGEGYIDGQGNWWPSTVDLLNFTVKEEEVDGKITMVVDQYLVAGELNVIGWRYMPAMPEGF